MKKKRSKIFKKEIAKDFVISLISESDRGCIIVGTSYLEYLTERLLRKSFCSDPKVIKEGINPLFDGLGPLSTFASRIKLLYALNLIDGYVYSMLNIIKDLRNACAHEFEHISFDDQFIKDIIDKMVFPKEPAIPFIEVETIKMSPEEDKELKEIEDYINNISYKEKDAQKVTYRMHFILSMIFVSFKIKSEIKKKTETIDSGVVTIPGLSNLE